MISAKPACEQPFSEHIKSRSTFSGRCRVTVNCHGGQKEYEDFMPGAKLTSVNIGNVLSIIMGGGQGTRLFPLTRDRSKPAVPLAGKYRLVDIPISNCINSGLKRIYLLTQFNSASLHRHISQSYKFDHFSGGFVEILAAEQTYADTSWY